MSKITFEVSNRYSGQGISHGLQRGLLVFYDNQNLVQEGMGIGAVALRGGNLTYFSQNGFVEKLRDNFYVKEYELDTLMVWNLVNMPSLGITRIIETMVNLYKHGSRSQEKLLQINRWMRLICHVQPRFHKIPSIGRVRVSYKIQNNIIRVLVDVSNLVNRVNLMHHKLYLMNELGGDYFTNIVKGMVLKPPPTGWVPYDIRERIAFHSKRLHLNFAFEMQDPNKEWKGASYVGREKLPDFSWAGFELELNLKKIVKKGKKENLPLLKPLEYKIIFN